MSELCTDKDVARFKEELDKFSCLTLDTEDGRGLIARMEAAERYCKTGSYKDRIAWRVSKGELSNQIHSREAAGK